MNSSQRVALPIIIPRDVNDSVSVREVGVGGVGGVMEWEKAGEEQGGVSLGGLRSTRC